MGKDDKCHVPAVATEPFITSTKNCQHLQSTYIFQLNMNLPLHFVWFITLKFFFVVMPTEKRKGRQVGEQFYGEDTCVSKLVMELFMLTVSIIGRESEFHICFVKILK